MEKTYETISSDETRRLGRLLAEELRGGELLAMTGELGSGKTTFTQGLLEGLGAEGPYTSPTFVVMKQYKIKSKSRKLNVESDNKKKLNQLQGSSSKLQVVYHIDAYRVNDNDILDLGWNELISNEKNVVIVEWADRVEKILPRDAIRINFRWVDENIRRISIGTL